MIVFWLLFALPLWALEYQGFVDTYYLGSFNSPKNHKRVYTTQPYRTDELNLNLIYGEVKEVGENFRGKLALQAGNSVDVNYAAEPNEDHKYLQEAYAGARFGEVWVDGGIFLGNIGAESWISRDNWTYSRALMLDYVPYYSTGLRASFKNFEIHVLQGWQNISETNSTKALGLHWKNEISSELQFSYNNFFGEEEVVSKISRFRGYHDFILKWLYSEQWHFLASVDVGHAAQQQNDGVDFWFAGALTVQHPLTKKESVALRIERYLDPHEANVVTGSQHGFNVYGASTNYDYDFGVVKWRTEYRILKSKDRLYPTHTTHLSTVDSFWVTSLSLTL